jgi:hypothetical protein
MLMFESANFDESVFGEPDSFASTEIPTGIWRSAPAPTSAWVISWLGWS